MKYAPYSFSKINCFKNCPQQFDWTYVNKIPIDVEYSDPSFFQRGRFVHKYLAHRLEGGAGEVYGYNSVTVEDKMNLIESAENALSDEYITMTYEFDVTKVENELRLDFDLLPTTFDKEFAIKGFVDYYAVDGEVGIIVDWKSGNYQEESKYDQLELYALWVFQTYPNVKEIDLLFYYIEHNKFNLKTVTLEDAVEFRENLSDSIIEIEKTKEFTINPSKSCQYCKFLETCRDKYDIEY